MKKGMIAVMTTDRWGPLGQSVVITHDKKPHDIYHRGEFLSEWNMENDPTLTHYFFQAGELEQIRGVRV